METIKGIPVFPGVAIGHVLILDGEGLPIADRLLAPERLEDEVRRVAACLDELAAEARENARIVGESLGTEIGKIFEAQGLMIADKQLRGLIVEQIRKNLVTPETAVRKVLGKYADFFRTMKSSHFADRASDIRDIEKRILDRLIGQRRNPLEGLDREVIVIARDLTPSETASFDPKIVRGIVTETGGRTSHTAIVAGAMEIPAIVGAGPLMDELRDGDLVIVDGHGGDFIIRPDERTLAKYRTKAGDAERFFASLGELRDLPAITLDGTTVELMGNIEFPQETAHCLDRGADGIGLYRTEFLYMDRTTPPDEEEHFAVYAAVVKAMGPDRPVVFRTMDAGADKLLDLVDHPKEYNPFLGLRSVRLSLKHIDVFKTQLRAILRASVFGDARIMFPLISTVLELRRCRMILADVVEDLEEEGLAFRRDIPVGMMVEVPSAAILAEQFADHVDFFSIGTNDLIQYTLACDRTNEHVASLYSASDPAILRLVRRVVKAANRRGIGVSVCGEMSADPIYAPLLLGLGLRQLSVTPHAIPEIKNVVRELSLDECEVVARRALRLDTASAVTNFLRNRKQLVAGSADA